MRKIVSNVLIVSTQLIIGGLFLFMLFSDNNEDKRNIVVKNDNMNKMADAVSELFVADPNSNTNDSSTEEVNLVSEEEKKAQEEAEAKAKAEEEARQRAAAEAEAVRIAAEQKAQEEAARNAIIVSANGYRSKPAAGFNVTTGNRTYSLSDGEFAILATVVNCEANRSSRDDVLAVMSVILNRADRNGGSPVSVVSARGQFSCYTGSGTTVSDSVASVMRDALYNGIRNNSYSSFGSWRSGVSNNYIVDGGNRYYR